MVYNRHMDILENFENAWDPEFQYESTPIKQTNHAGEPLLSTNLISETCCNGCSCQTSQDHKPE